MIGWFRLVLAYLVVVSHLGVQFDPGAVGTFAVQGFYVASGFLMTAVLNGPYIGRSGAFWANRFLKLFPAYWIVCLSSLALFLYVPVEAGEFRRFWTIDADLETIFANITMLPFAFDSLVPKWHWMLVTQSWSVAIELMNYAVIFAVTCRGRKAAMLMLAIGIAYHMSCFVVDGSYWRPRYVPWYAGLVPFSVGALAWFATNDRPLPFRWGALATIAWALNFSSANWVVQDTTMRDGWMWYANILLVAVIVSAFAPLRRESSINRVDAFVGDLAYPIFLVHLTTRFATQLALQRFGIDPTAPIALVAELLTVLPAALAVAFLSRAIVEPLRDQVRTGLVRRSSARDAEALAARSQRSKKGLDLLHPP